MNVGANTAIGTSSDANGLNLTTYTGADAQLWQLDQFPDAGYRIRNKATGTTLTATPNGLAATPFVRDDLHLWTITTP